ncbi:ammonium transporter [Nocardioides sp. LML1-1-1.1]|uniref:ammonium transporter n=1 Tax=Nocardioides sp. LML1-1-1.1 TaxID=3135248 RepID=UPI00344019E1
MTDSTAWLLLSTALVIFMTPGVAFFYGGLVKSKSVVSMMMLSFGSMGLVSVLWILYGFNMGLLDGDGLGSFVANPFSDFALEDLSKVTDGSPLAGVAFGASFAIITVALISGAIADRARFWPWMLFAGVWATTVYFLVQGWVWAFDDDGMTGWVGKFGFGDTATMDWAGGTAVHINAGAAALALALVLGKRKVGFSKEEAQPHNVPLVLIGAAILWFGWFGFNTGLNTGEAGAGLIFLNTIGAPAAAMIGWMLVEQFKEGKATAVGAASGAVAGLVAITPACAFLSPIWSLLLGLIAGAVCAFAIDLKFKLGFDDTLDVVGIHMVGGFIGCWFLGFFATDTGLFTGGGNLNQLGTQVVTSLGVAAYSFVMAWVIGTVIEKTIGFRAKEEDEVAGIDLALHGGGYAID